jgi:hypothetical protein
MQRAFDILKLFPSRWQKRQKIQYVHIVRFLLAFAMAIQGLLNSLIVLRPTRVLSHPEHDQSPFFLQKAQNALQEALISLDPLSFQRKPTLLADLAVVSIYRQDIEEACTLISQAATLATQMHLHKVTQRLVALREPLSPWKELASVKTLDAHLAFLSSQGNKQR